MKQRDSEHITELLIQEKNESNQLSQYMFIFMYVIVGNARGCIQLVMHFQSLEVTRLFDNTKMMNLCPREEQSQNRLTYVSLSKRQIF